MPAEARLLSSFVTIAAAHVGQPVGGVDLTLHPDGIELETSWGLVVPAATGGWRWICHEAVTEPGAQRSPRYARSGADRLAWLPDALQGRGGSTLFHSPDGCAWDAVAGSDRVLVRDAAYDAERPGVAWAAAGEEAWRSEDGGATFAVAFRAPGRDLRGIRPLGEGAVATAVDLAGEAASVVWFDGVAVVEQALPEAAPPVDARVVALDGDEALVVLDGFGADRLLRVGPDGVVPVVDAAGQLTDVALDGETTWVGEDGVRLLAVRDGVAEPVPAWPLALGLEVADGVLWSAPQSWVVGSLVSRSDDGGASFVEVAYPDDVAAPLQCPADSPVATACEPLWETLLPDLRGYDDPPGDSGRPPDLADPDRPDDAVVGTPGCGCGSAGSGAFGAWWVALGAAARRAAAGRGRAAGR